MTSYRYVTFAFVAVLAFTLGFALPSGVLAASPAPEGRLPEMPVPPGAGPGVEMMVDAAAFAEVVAITERIEDYLYVGADGLVYLADVTADEIGVSEQFLADYRSAMAYSNALIADGSFAVAEDLSVTMLDEAPSLITTDPIGPGPVIDAAPGEGPGAVPEWGAWNYNTGGMFYNSYQDWTYYRYNNRYYNLCNSLAAFIRRPHMSGSLIWFYGYNQSYFNRYCYNPYGVYYYVPYSYCNNYLGYKPAYFWTYRTVYSYGCYCYQTQWYWQGIWGRY